MLFISLLSFFKSNHFVDGFILGQCCSLVDNAIHISIGPHNCRLVMKSCIGNGICNNTLFNWKPVSKFTGIAATVGETVCVCTNIYDPVCDAGTGRTFGNPCEAECA